MIFRKYLISDSTVQRTQGCEGQSVNQMVTMDLNI